MAFQTGPDYEYPSDDDGDNVYHVSLSISDGAADGGQVDYAVTVTDDPPEGCCPYPETHMTGPR